jgi:hypothetical protein
MQPANHAQRSLAPFVFLVVCTHRISHRSEAVCCKAVRKLGWKTRGASSQVREKKMSTASTVPLMRRTSGGPSNAKAVYT